MKIEFLKPYSMSAVGDVLDDVPDSTAQLLIKRGIAKSLDVEKVHTKPFTKRIRRK